MPETRRQKILIENFDSQKLLLFSHILDLKNDLTTSYSKKNSENKYMLKGNKRHARTGGVNYFES